MCQHRTPIRAGVFQVSEPCQGPVPTLRDMGLTRGTQHALLGAPDPLVQGSEVLPRRSRPIEAPWGVLYFLATRCSQPCPCGGVGCCFPCDPGVSHGCGVFIQQKGGTAVSRYRQLLFGDQGYLCNIVSLNKIQFEHTRALLWP
jgi:hypothetical protein